MKATILDDEVILANSLAAKLENSGFEVKTYYSYEEFENKIDDACDIFIFDISIGDTSGFDVIGEVRAKNLQTPIIIISGHESLNYKIEGLNIGADDYLVKPFHPDELLARIQTVLRRKHPELKENILEYKDISLNLGTREILKNGEKVDMTKKEKDIVEFFMLRQGRLIQKKEVVNSIWLKKDPDLVTDNNINVTIFNIRNKLGKEFELETKIGEGYVLNK